MKRNITVVVIALVLVLILWRLFPRKVWRFYCKIFGHTITSAISKYQPHVEKRLATQLHQFQAKTLPNSLAILAFKKEKLLELWIKQDSTWQFFKSYPILGASGHLGPKIREGDLQVPEGIYEITSFNPNSFRHLSMEISYPNEFDRQIAAQQNRQNLGNNIFIHGGSTSEGCIAIGNTAIEEVFVLTALAESPVKVIIAPTDFRNQDNVMELSEVEWVQELYENIRGELREFSKK